MYILFDIGGTKMRIAASRDGEHFEDPVKLPTPVNDFDAGMRLFAETSRRLAGGEPIRAVVGGIAGPLDEHKKMLVNAPNISGWVNKPLREELQKLLECEVQVENDSDVVGLGEATHGAGRGSSIVAYLTVSTGVGGSRIVDGLIDRNRFGFEPGHQIIKMDDESGICGSCVALGHLQGYISGNAFLRLYGQPAHAVEDVKAWESAARTLAVGLNNVAVFWSPDVIIVGGAMMVGTVGAVIPFDRVEHHFGHILDIFPQKPALRLAELGDNGGLYGAMELVRRLEIPGAR